MEPVILEKKIALLDPSTDGHVKDVLQAVVNSQQQASKVLEQHLKPLFLRFFARLCQEEGVARLSTANQEKSLKDRLPDTVANWLTVLSEILTSRIPSERVVDPVYTSSVLLLRLHEWINWNYDRRFIYGDKIEQEAERHFGRLENEMDLLGDKDEILSLTIDGLSAFCTNYWIDQANLLPGVKTYFINVKFDYGRGQRSLQLGIRSVLVDQVKFRALCPDQHILAHLLENLIALSSIGISPSNNYI